jgi:hypothetical protein
VKEIFSTVEEGILLHIVNRKEEIVQEREDIVSEDQFIQLSTLRLPEGKTFRPHKHIWKRGETKAIAQESWVVIQGKVKCFFYDLDDSLLTTEILSAGDCSVTLMGGHTYEILEDDTLVYEYKTGPYKGQHLDKEFIEEKA